jgi:hypothetical protein
MPLTAAERVFLKRVYQNMDPNKPLEPGDPFYQPIHELPGCTDPVEILFSAIDFAGTESRQFFSGFRGSGKTTELLRLKRKLEGEGYLVFYADALEYINPGEPIDISDLLIVIAGAFSDAVDKFDPEINTLHESYWSRFKNYLTTTEVQLDEIKLTPIKDVAELKLALKDAPSFRKKVQQMMSNRLFELESQVRKFLEDIVKAIRERHEQRKIVFLFDQLEQIRGTLFNEREVISSVERLFRLHLNRLSLPYIHTVYTVPPWLKFAYPGLEVVILPTVRQWERNADRTRHKPGDDCLLELVKKRFVPDSLSTLFADEQRAEEYISLCGGHFRDLLRLFRAAFVRAQSLPLSEEVIKAAILDIRSSFLPIAFDDAVWLSKVAETRDSGLQDTSPESVSRFTRFLDTHFVLYLRNGQEWYDIHPLIREEVNKIVRSAESGELRDVETA